MKQKFVFLLPLLFFALYLLTAQRGVSWGDSGLFQYRLLINDHIGQGGLACAHPLYIIVGSFLSKFLPKEVFFWGVNAFSGFWASLALTFLCLSARLLGVSAKGVAFAVLTLGFSHLLWSMSALAEVYTMSLFALSLEIYFGLRFLESGRARWFVLLFLANGLHFSIHNYALLNLPVYALLAGRLLRSRHVKTVVAATGVWLLGSSFILSLGIDHFRAGGDLWASIQTVLMGNYTASVAGTGAPSLKTVFINFMLTGLSVVLPLFWAGVRFYATNFKLLRVRRDLRFVAALLVVQFVFWVRYFVPDQWTFALPTLFLTVLLFSVATCEIRCWKRLLGATLLLSVLMPWAICRAGFVFPDAVRRSRVHVARDNMRYFIVPWKHDERSAETFAAAVEEIVPDGARVYADFTNVTPLASKRGLAAWTSPGATPSYDLADVYFNHGEPSKRPTAVYEVYPFGVYRVSPAMYEVGAKKGPLHELLSPRRPYP